MRPGNHVQVSHSRLSWLRLIAGELRRYLIECRAYWPSFVSQTAVMIVMFAVFVWMSPATSRPSGWYGYFLWIVASGVISEAPIATNSEKQRGTLEQLMVRPHSLPRLMMVKSVSWVTINLVLAILTMGIIVVLFRLPLGFSWEILPIALVGIASTFGFALLLSALTLLWSKVSGLVSVLTFLLLLCTGAVVPVTDLPGPLQWLAAGLPLTASIGLGKAAIAGLGIVPAEVFWLLINAIIYIVLGWLCCRLVIRVALRRGITMHY
ncbi:MAG: ABC transporter permease [Propionibacteriaceae bacterium]|nr:ABC transporter permease [Propionibacteriaceae bacterium]